MSPFARFHPQPLLASPSRSIHKSTHAQFPSGQCNFLFCLTRRGDSLVLRIGDSPVPLGLSLGFTHRVLTTCILELVLGCHSPIVFWTASQSVAVYLNFGFPHSHDAIHSYHTAFPRTSGQHQSQLVTATFCFVCSGGAALVFFGEGISP